MRENGSIRVFIVDDHPVMIEGIRFLIESEENLSVCGTAQTAQKALSQIAKTAPDIAVVDISLGGTSGLTLTQDIAQRHPQLPIVIFSMHKESLYAERAIQAGAKGYVSKNKKPQELIAAIHKILEGHMSLSEEVITSILQKPRRKYQEQKFLGGLNNRELEVFSLIGRGLTSHQISENLNISLSTVYSHKTNIKNKLNLQNATELAYCAANWVKEQDSS